MSLFAAQRPDLTTPASSCHRRPRFRSVCLGILAVAGWITMGCDVPRRPEFRVTENSDDEASSGNSSKPSATEPTLDSEPSVNTLMLRPVRLRYGVKQGPGVAQQPFVGEQRLIVSRDPERFELPASSTIRLDRRVWLRQGNLRLVDRLEITEQQDDRGEVLQWTVLRQQGPWVKKLRGRVEKRSSGDKENTRKTGRGSMLIESLAGRPEKRRVIKWMPEDRGFFVNQSLFSRRSSTSEQSFGPLRVLRIESGDNLVQPAEAMVNIAGQVRVTIDDQSRDLPEVITSYRRDESVVGQHTTYVDAEGWPWRMVDQDQYVAMRVDEDRDLGLEWDPARDLEVRVSGQPWKPDSSDPISIRLRPLADAGDVDFGETIPAAPGQSVVRVGRAVEVRLHDEGKSERGQGRDPGDREIGQPIAADTQATKMVNHGHPAVRKIATAASRGMSISDVSRIAFSAADTTWAIIETEPRFQGLVPASKVGVDLSGDIFGRATLAAAMLRWKGVPTRLALGVVVRDQQITFHAWPIAWIDERWQTIDEERRSTDRLALAITDFEFDSVYDAIEQVLLTLSSSQIEVLGVR